LNLDGTHSLVKKSAESAAYQHRKKAKTSNVLILTDGNGIPIAIGNILSGNHNDLYADKGFDSKSLRRACHRRKIVPNIIENSKNRKKTKRGRKRFFSQKVYDNRFVNERAFAWIDSFRTLLIRFDKLDNVWLNWHYLAFSLILLKV